MYDPTKISQNSSNFRNMFATKSAALTLKMDQRSNATGKSGGGGFGGNFGGAEDNNLMEMMVMQGQATDVVRMEYIEEPSFRKSLFTAPIETTGLVTKQQRTTKLCIIMMVISFLCFGVATICFKAVYLNYRHTIWEDIYGRGVVFFACSSIHYLLIKGPQSVFDLRKTIRQAFFTRVILISFAYIFLFISLQWSSSFMYVALILCVLPPTCKVLQRYALIEKSYSFWDVLVMGTAIGGLFFLFRGESHFVNKSKYINTDDFDFDNLRAYIFGILTILCWGFANATLQKNKAYVHHTIDAFYVGFFISLFVPGIILGYFSHFPTKLTYEWLQLFYIIFSGIMWWIFHTMFTQVMEQDIKLNYLPAIYIFLVMAVAGDGIVTSKGLAWNQIIAFGLIVGPNVALHLLRAFKVIQS